MDAVDVYLGAVDTLASKYRIAEMGQRASTRKPVAMPHNYEDIIKDSDSTINNDNLQDHLHSGIFSSNKTKKYWIEDSGTNCFMLFARDLTICWGSDSRYWRWPLLKDITSAADDEGLVEVAELLDVCWLDVNGKFETSNLTPETTYEVVFVVMIKQQSYGWEIPVNLKLVLPDGQTQQRQEKLSTKMRSQWIRLQAGEFYNKSNNNGTMNFSLFECDRLHWKSGLLIKGVIIKPKK